jgi:hypothetical protein
LRRTTSGWLRWVIAIALVVLLSVLLWSNYRFAVQSPGGNDFLARWTGAHYWLIEGLNPYDEQVSLEAQKLIYGRPADPTKGEDIAHFVYPLPAMIFFAPFGYLPYTLARALWMTLLEILLPILAFLGVRLARWKVPTATFTIIMLLSIFWYHGLRSVIVGQFAVIEAVLIVGALWAIQRDSDAMAGLLMGLSISKPQMAFLILPYICFWAIREKRIQLLLWTLATSLGLIVLSILLLPDWPLLWLRQLVSYPTYTNLGSPISIMLSGLPENLSLLSWILMGGLIAYLFLEWGLSFGKGDTAFQWTSAMTLVITNLVAFRTATTNFVIMLPALILIFHSWAQRWGRRGRAAVWIASFGLIGGLWLLFLLTVDGNVEAPIMYLPLPIFAFVSLLWSRWWILRGSRQPSMPSQLPLS